MMVTNSEYWESKFTKESERYLFGYSDGNRTNIVIFRSCN